MKKAFFFSILLIIPVFAASVQETVELFIPEFQSPSLAPENPEPPPRQFRRLYLGMTLSDLQRALTVDNLFHFRGPPDVSFLPFRQETLVETTGRSFIRRAHFQLVDDQVYIMSFTMNPRVMDHHSVFTAFIRRYGEPVTLNPTEAVWESDDTRVSIERPLATGLPLTVKYIDRTVFDRLIEESRVRERTEVLLRSDFLNEF